MKSELQLLKDANDILRSVNSIIERKGKNTNWEAIEKKVKIALDEQHQLLLAKNCYIGAVIKSVCKCTDVYLRKSGIYKCKNPKCGKVFY